MPASQRKQKSTECGMRFSCGRQSLQCIDTGDMLPESVRLCRYSLVVEPIWLRVVAVVVVIVLVLLLLLLFVAVVCCCWWVP